MKPVLQTALKAAGLIIGTTALLTLAGCSSIGKLQKVDSVEKVDDENFTLTKFYNEPVQGFDSWALRLRSQALCPTGYHYLLRKAGRSSELATEHATCASGTDCEYALEWRIKCTDQPQEKFTIFGKS